MKVLGPEDSRNIRDGACLACLEGGEVRFPLDPGHHAQKYGHAPVLADLPKICALLGITVERWESLAEAVRITPK